VVGSDQEAAGVGSSSVHVQQQGADAERWATSTSCVSSRCKHVSAVHIDATMQRATLAKVILRSTHVASIVMPAPSTAVTRTILCTLLKKERHTLLTA
jgi:hypothetical protein